MVVRTAKGVMPKVRPHQGTRHWARRLGSSVLLYGALVGLACLFGGPFLWTVLSSLKAPEELFMFPPRLLPARFQWANYVVIWQQAPLGRFLWNTVVVTVLAVIGQILSASLVA